MRKIRKNALRWFSLLKKANLCLNKVIYYNYLDDNKKCYCSSNKKYRNCCKSEDITGDMDTDIFFCDIDKFKKFYDNYQKNKDSNDKKNLKNYNLSKSNINDCPNKNSNCENNSIVDKMSEIFIWL